MALSTSLQLNVMTSGTDGLTGNGGGFDPGGCTFDNTSSVTSANTSAPVVTCTNYNFVAGDVGHYWYLNSGTSSIPGWYIIASVASNLATLDASIGKAQLANGGLNTVAGCGTASSLSTQSASVDYSRKAAALITYSDLTTLGAGATATSVLNPFGVNHIGNMVAISSSGAFNPGRYKIISISGVTATFDVTISTGASSAGVGKLGGALASTGQAGVLHIGKSKVWVQYNATDYSISSATSNVTLGRCTLAAGGADGMSLLRGYDVVFGDETGNRPKLKATTGMSSNALVAGTTSYFAVENIILDGNTQTGTRALLPVAQSIFKNLKIMGMNSGAWSAGVNNVGISDCEFNACITTAVCACLAGSYSFRGCSFQACTVTQITCSTGSVNIDGVDAYNNTGGTTNFFTMTGIGSIRAQNVTIGTIGQHGYEIQVAPLAATFENCYVQGAGNGGSGYGWTVGATADNIVMYNCGGYNNTSGDINTTNITSRYHLKGFITVTADAFTTLGSGILTLNNNSPGGAQLRNAGWVSSYPGMTGTNYEDVGAFRHQDAASGASSRQSLLSPVMVGRPDY